MKLSPILAICLLGLSTFTILPLASAGATASPNFVEKYGYGSTNSLNNVMLGTALAFTPTSSGTVLVTITGTLPNSGLGNPPIVGVIGYYGTGTAPSLGDSVPAGAVNYGYDTGGIQTPKSILGQTSGQGYLTFSSSAVVSGLTIGTTYWFDVAFNVDNGASALLEVDILVIELNPPVSSGTCPVNKYLSGFNSTGGLVCVALPVSAGTCPAGQLVAGFDSTGKFICKNPPSAGTTSPTGPSGNATTIAQVSNATIRAQIAAYVSGVCNISPNAALCASSSVNVPGGQIPTPLFLFALLLVAAMLAGIAVVSKRRSIKTTSEKIADEFRGGPSRH